jgi:hypothetical protein
MGKLGKRRRKDRRGGQRVLYGIHLGYLQADMNHTLFAFPAITLYTFTVPGW